MGKLVKIDPDTIIPSQDYLKEDTIKFILENIISGSLGSLPPPPIVRKTDGTKNYIAIDGHSMLVVKSLLGENVEVYVAESSSDLLSQSKLDIFMKKRNNELSKNFDIVLVKVRKAGLNGIGSILDLRKKYNFLKDLETAKRYFGI